MGYKEYIASEGKALLNLDTFSTSIKTACRSDIELSIIELSPEEAEYYHNKYEEELVKQQDAIQHEELVEEVVEEQPALLKGTKNLRATTVDSVQRLKNFLKEEMVLNDYNLNNLVKPIIHE